MRKTLFCQSTLILINIIYKPTENPEIEPFKRYCKGLLKLLLN